QHAHYQFLKPENQRHVLDQYAQHKPCLDAVQTAYKSYTASQRELVSLQNAQQQRLDRAQLLAYQVQELDEFSLGEHEFEQLETDFKKQNNTQDLLSNSQAALFALKDDDNANAISSLNQSIKALSNVAQFDESVNGIIESLQGALIQAEDAANELDHYAQEIEADPAQLAELEARYTKCLDLARKHHVQPEQLFDAHLQLASEYALLTQEEDSLVTLEQTVKQQLLDYQSAADKLTNSRVKASKLLSNEIQTAVREMNLPHALVDVKVISDSTTQPALSGNDTIQIHLSVNPGQALEVMEKVVSGGELSRIGLALQVISSKDTYIPTMVFDEVDTGISGPTASLIGKLLRKLGEKSQVMCVTHLPQVAAQAHNQLFVSKVTDGKSTETTLLKLTKEERVNEIARLLAGDELTNTAIANAKDLLKL
ncbi:MAG: DNA repair protein RecN, partial [Glaciecola sp.]